MENNIQTVKKADVLIGLDSAINDYKVVALTKQSDKILYDYITNSKDIILDYQQTILPPKKFFFPQEETLLGYDINSEPKAKYESEPLVVFGVRPCDLNALKILDEAFTDDHGDPNYLAKREESIIIGVDCKKICDEHAFCYKVDSHNAKGGFDIMLQELDTKYIVTIASKKGENFAKKYFSLKQGSQDDIDKFQKEKQVSFANKNNFKNLNDLPSIMEKNKKHKVWEEEGSRCLSCGSCIMVCPTCYCFDVNDELNLDLKTGKRIRTWDACMLCDFAVIAGGENFRCTANARLKHRINRKFNYLMKKHKQPVCVGCGRCVSACLADISPRYIIEVLTNDTKE